MLSSHHQLTVIVNGRFSNSVLHNCTNCKSWISLEAKSPPSQEGCEAAAAGVSECPVVLRNESAVGERSAAAAHMAAVP